MDYEATAGLTPVTSALRHTYEGELSQTLTTGWHTHLYGLTHRSFARHCRGALKTSQIVWFVPAAQH
jgi:hypothetical protein